MTAATLIPELTPAITSLMLVLTRVGAMLMATPVFRSTGVPARVRIVLALTFSLLAVAALPPDYQAPAIDAGLVAAIVSEVGLGLAMGFMIQLVFASLAIAGEACAMGMGLGFATMIDPANGNPVPTLSQLFMVLSTLIFVALDGHLQMLGMLFVSFDLLPPGSSPFAAVHISVLLEWAMLMYAHAMFIALPIIVAVLLTNILFGVITRAAPQLNLFAIGFPMMLLLGIFLIFMNVEHVAEGARSLLRAAFSEVDRLIGTP